MSLPYQYLNGDDSYRTSQTRRDIVKRRRAYKDNRQSDMAEPWEYDWVAKERGKNHHERFCQAVRHADAVNERFAFVKFPFTPYWSSLQQCYHVGRNRRMEPVAAIKFLRYSRARDRLTNSDSQQPLT